MPTNGRLVVSISSTESDLADWALTATGVGKITRKRTTSDAHAPGLNYSVANLQALAVLRDVAPYLRSYKRHRVRLVLEHYVALTPRNGKYSRAMAVERERFASAFLAIKARPTVAQDGRPGPRQGGAGLRTTV